MRHAAALLALLAAAACSGGGSASSTRLALSWNPPSNLAVSRYDVVVSESGSTSSRATSTTNASFTIDAPTGSLALQVLYIAITDGTLVPFTAVAMLLNP